MNPDPNYPKAVFRAPGVELVDGQGVTSRVVADGEQLEQALADGWHEKASAAVQAHQDELDAAAAREKKQDEPAAPTRAELEQKAKELGISFKPQTSDKKLAADIEAKLAEAAQ